MKLYLEKRGCDFSPLHDKDLIAESDLGNFRLFLEFISKDGRRVCGDISRCDLREHFTNKRGRADYKTISRNGLSAHMCYEDHTGCYAYDIHADFTPRYTKASSTTAWKSWTSCPLPRTTTRKAPSRLNVNTSQKTTRKWSQRRRRLFGTAITHG